MIHRIIRSADNVFLHPRVARLSNMLVRDDGRLMAGIIIALGILLRLLPYLHNRSLWLDEAWLALNIIQKSFSELMGVLDYKQMAPVGFLFVEKMLVLGFGESEYALRAFPLLAGILSLFLFYEVARRILTVRGRIIALGIFSISEPLLRYSSELKQYSSDVAVALEIYLMGLTCIEKESRYVPSLFLFSIIGAILIWFSHPAIFSLAGVGLALTLYCLKTRKWSHAAWLALPACFWLGSFGLNYFFTHLDLLQDSKMVRAWSGSSAFLPMLPLSVWELLGYQEAFFNMFRNPGGLSLYGLAAFCFVVGWLSAFSEKRYALYILTFPFLFTILASGLQRYPFHGRLILFLVPAMLIFIGEGVDRIVTLAKPKSTMMLASLCGLLVLIPVQWAVFTLINPGRLELEEVRPVMTYLSQNYRNEDRLYLYHSSEPAFLYYAKRFGFENTAYHRGVGSKRNWTNYISDLQKLRGNERVWILFSHVLKNNGVNEEKLFLHILDGMGKQLDSFKRRGASIYLYELTSPPLV